MSNPEINPELTAAAQSGSPELAAAVLNPTADVSTSTLVVQAPAQPEPIPPTEEITPATLKALLTDEFKKLQQTLAMMMESVPTQYGYISMSLRDPNARLPVDRQGNELPNGLYLEMKIHQFLPIFVPFGKNPKMGTYHTPQELVIEVVSTQDDKFPGLVVTRRGDMYTGSTDRIIARQIEASQDQQTAGQPPEVMKGQMTFQYNSTATPRYPEDVHAEVQRLFNSHAGWKAITVSHVYFGQGTEDLVVNPHCGVMILHKAANPDRAEMFGRTYYLNDSAQASKLCHHLILPEGDQFKPVLFHRDGTATVG